MLGLRALIVQQIIARQLLQGPCDPAPGREDTPDGSSEAASQIQPVFGNTTAANFTTADSSVNFSGPAEWTLRRMVLHYAKLCAAVNAIDAGAIDAFLIGSEFRALCSVRDSATNFPAVARLKTLAADVKGILGGGVKVSYAADWSDYNG